MAGRKITWSNCQLALSDFDGTRGPALLLARRVELGKDMARLGILDVHDSYVLPDSTPARRFVLGVMISLP